MILLPTKFEKNDLEKILDKYIISHWLYWNIININDLYKYLKWYWIILIINKNNEFEQLEFISKNEINLDILFEKIQLFLKLQKTEPKI